MGIRVRTILGLVVPLALMAVWAPAAAGDGDDGGGRGGGGDTGRVDVEDGPSLANYYGTTIDLTKGWGDAQACATDGAQTDCFNTEAELDEFLGEGAAARAACATSLRLYDGTSFGLPVVALTNRGVWTNLSPLGFDNKTSSYIVGACGSVFARSSGGGGGWYPGNTAAFASASTMLAGWGNAVSSIYVF